jgi:hypothetical protein
MSFVEDQLLNGGKAAAKFGKDYIEYQKAVDDAKPKPTPTPTSKLKADDFVDY